MTTKELCRYARITPRQAQWWSENGVITPTIIADRREWSAADVAIVFVVAELRRRGVSLQSVRYALKTLPQILAGNPRFLLFVEGKLKTLCVGLNTPEEVIQRAAATKQGVHLVCLPWAAEVSQAA